MIDCSEEISVLWQEIFMSSQYIDSLYKEIEGTIFVKNFEIKEESYDNYWRNRYSLEEKIAIFLRMIRECIENIPIEYKSYYIEKYTDMNTMDERQYKKYNDINFSSLMRYYDSLINKFESHDGILNRLENKMKISEEIRAVRNKVYLISETLHLFPDKNKIDIEKYVELIFYFRDNNMEDISVSLEEIESNSTDKEKCFAARTALEKMLKQYLLRKEIEIKQGFYSNLDLAIKSGLTEEQKRKSIASQYSYISKICHEEIEATKENTEYAIIGILNIMDSLRKKF